MGRFGQPCKVGVGPIFFFWNGFAGNAGVRGPAIYTASSLYICAVNDTCYTEVHSSQLKNFLVVVVGVPGSRRRQEEDDFERLFHDHGRCP